MPSRCLLLFTKPAVAGRVKTRLTGAGGLSEERAARLHAAFLGDLVERLLPLAGGEGREAEVRVRVAWALGKGAAEEMTIPDLGEEIGKGGDGLAVPGGAAVDAVAQSGEDLGERLFRALEAAAQEHSGGVAAVGSDHPTLPRRRVREAFESLRRADVALGPADDGGYYLIALRPRAVRRRLFADVPWSTPGVLAATEERCQELGLTVEHLAAGHDVDEPKDLRRLARHLAAEPETDHGGALGRVEPLRCPRTRRLLDAWGLLPEIPTTT